MVVSFKIFSKVAFCAKSLPIAGLDQRYLMLSTVTVLAASLVYTQYQRVKLALKQAWSKLHKVILDHTEISSQCTLARFFLRCEV